MFSSIFEYIRNDINIKDMFGYGLFQRYQNNEKYNEERCIIYMKELEKMINLILHNHNNNNLSDLKNNTNNIIQKLSKVEYKNHPCNYYINNNSFIFHKKLIEGAVNNLDISDKDMKKEINTKNTISYIHSVYEVYSDLNNLNYYIKNKLNEDLSK
jgi:hypothetical protein